MTKASDSSPSLSSLPMNVRLKIETICQRFEETLQANKPPQIEQFIDKNSDLPRKHLLRELLVQEIQYFARSGENPMIELYLTRFPKDIPMVQQAFSIALPVLHGIVFGSIPPISEVKEELRYFGGYELLREINRGGMGIVYLARQQSLGRIVAVKTILSGLVATEQDIKRFQTEAKAAARLDHPGIVPIHEIGLHKGKHYFSMTYVDGPSLAQELKRGPMEPFRAAEIMSKAAEAVQAAHDQSIIHRDIKPANILLAVNDTPRITDFGLAKILNSPKDATPGDKVLGTLLYMSPEQATATTKITFATDIYSLGATLYELLTGRPPFSAASVLDTLKQITESKPVSLRLLNPAIPVHLEGICMKCLMKDPLQRYKTAAELAEALARFVEGIEVEEESEIAPVPKKKQISSLQQPESKSKSHSWTYKKLAGFIVGFVILLGLIWLVPNAVSRLSDTSFTITENGEGTNSDSDSDSPNTDVKLDGAEQTSGISQNPPATINGKTKPPIVMTEVRKTDDLFRAGQQFTCSEMQENKAASEFILTIVERSAETNTVRAIIQPEGNPTLLFVMSGVMSSVVQDSTEGEGDENAPVKQLILSRDRNNAQYRDTTILSGANKVTLKIKQFANSKLIADANSVQVKVVPKKMIDNIDQWSDLVRSVIKPGNVWKGTLEKKDNSVETIMMTFTETRHNGRYIRAIIERTGNPFLPIIVEGRLSVSQNDLFLQPLIFHKKTEGVGYKDVFFGKLVNNDSTINIHVDWDTKTLIGITRQKEYFRLTQVSKKEMKPLHDLTTAKFSKFLKRSCAVGQVWKGTLANKEESISQEVTLRFLNSGEGKSGVKANLTKGDGKKPSDKVTLTGLFELDDHNINRFPANLKRTGGGAGHGSNLFSVGFPVTVQFRHSRNGRTLYGFTKYGERLILTPMTELPEE